MAAVQRIKSWRHAPEASDKVHINYQRREECYLCDVWKKKNVWRILKEKVSQHPKNIKVWGGWVTTAGSIPASQKQKFLGHHGNWITSYVKLNIKGEKSLAFFQCFSPSLSSFSSCPVSLSLCSWFTGEKSHRNHTFSSSWWFDLNSNWSSWAASVWFYALCCRHTKQVLILLYSQYTKCPSAMSRCLKSVLRNMKCTVVIQSSHINFT